MIKKIIHIADIQFRTYQRIQEFRAVCENFISQLAKHKPDRVVIAGDLVHSRNQLTPELVNEVSWFLKECAKYCGRLVIIPGNHDIVEQNKDRMDALTPIVSALDMANIDYYKRTTVAVDENIAWVVYSLIDNNVTPDELTVNDYTGKIKMGLFHGMINGATNNQGFTFMHGSDVERFNVCHMVLCGDIHKRQVLVTKAGVHAIYPGSMIQQDFAETISQHGYNMVTIDESGKLSYEFFDLDNPVKYLHFKINDYSDIEEGKELLVNA